MRPKKLESPIRYAVNMPESTMHQLSDLAWKMRISRSELIRRIFQEYLGRVSEEENK